MPAGLMSFRYECQEESATENNNREKTRRPGKNDNKTAR